MKAGPKIKPEKKKEAEATTSPQPVAAVKAAPKPYMVGEQVQAALDKVNPSPTNPRKFFDAGKLRELADSIVENGIISPILARRMPKYEIAAPDLVSDEWRVLKVGQGGSEVVQSFPKDMENSAHLVLATYGKAEFEIVAGERRWRAAKLAGLTSVPLLVRELTDGQVREIQLIENDQREDINAFERAEGYRQLRDELGYTVEEICQKVGQKRSTVYNALQALKLPEVVRKAFSEAGLAGSFVNLLAMVPGEKNQLKVVAEIVEGESYWDHDENKTVSEPLSFRNALALVKKKYTLDLKRVKFSTKATDLFGDENSMAAMRVRSSAVDGFLGACEVCPHRTGTDPAAFPEFKNPNICTKPACCQEKEKAHVAAQIEKFEKQGCTVLSVKEGEKLFQWGDVKRDAGYVKAEGICYDDKKQRSYEKLLGGAKEVQPVVAIHDGQPVKLFKIAEALPVLEKAGVKPERIKPEKKETPEEKAKRELEVKTDKAIEQATVAAIVAAVEAKADTVKMQVAAMQFALPVIYTRYETNTEPIVERRGWNDSQENLYIDDIKEMGKKLETLGQKELLGFIVETSLTESYGDYDGDRLKLACDWLKIDAKEITARVKKEMTEQAKDAKSKTEHVYEKQNLVTTKKGDLYKCKVCGVTAVRPGLDWPPVRDKKYAMAKYMDCTWMKPTPPSER